MAKGSHIFFYFVVLVMLRLNVAKTKFMIVGFRQRLQTQAEVSIQAHIEGKEINNKTALQE